MRCQAIGAKAACLLIASIASISAQAATIGITYSVDAIALTAPPVLNGTLLTLDALWHSSIISGNPALDTTWNPVTFHTRDFLDITTGISTGIFDFKFANGSTLSGNFLEVQSAEFLATQMGSFTNMFTFTGGTGQFVGASGSISGGGLVRPDGFTVGGSGTLTAAGLPTPEPASAALIVGGLLVMVASQKLLRQRTLSETQRSFRAELANSTKS